MEFMIIFLFFSMAKPAVFNGAGKKAYYNRSNSNSSSTSEQAESSHEEIVRYVSEGNSLMITFNMSLKVFS